MVTLPQIAREFQKKDHTTVMYAVDKIREKYGDTTVSLASGLTAAFRARVHENPENLPGKDPRKKE